jgi:hypothetical protein
VLQRELKEKAIISKTKQEEIKKTELLKHKWTAFSREYQRIIQDIAGVTPTVSTIDWSVYDKDKIKEQGYLSQAALEATESLINRLTEAENMLKNDDEKVSDEMQKDKSEVVMSAAATAAAIATIAAIAVDEGDDDENENENENENDNVETHNQNSGAIDPNHSNSASNSTLDISVSLLADAASNEVVLETYVS